MISFIVVSALDMSCELVLQIELSTTKALENFNVGSMLGFHMIFQALVSGECSRTNRTKDLCSELFRDVFTHLKLKLVSWIFSTGDDHGMNLHVWQDCI